MDIQYGYVAGKLRHFYVASIIDIFDRSIVAHYRGKSCSAADIEKTVQKAILYRRADAKSLIIRTDNGPQFISKAFHEYCERMELEHERIPNKTPYRPIAKNHARGGSVSSLASALLEEKV